MFANPNQKLSAAAPHRDPHRHLEVVESPVRTTPPWFRLMLSLRKVSTPLVILLTFSLLPLYGWTVYTQKTWGQTYAQLEQLKRDERNLLLQNESRQYDITETAEKNPVGLTPKGSHNTLFVKPEPARLPQPTADDSRPPIQTSPVGY